MCDPRDLNRHSASAVAGPQDHRHGQTPWSVPGESTMHCSGEHTFINISFFSQESCTRAVRSADRFLSIALFVFIYSQHACANVHFVKIHLHPPCPPPRKRTGEALSPFSGGKNRGAGFRSQKVGAGSDGKGRR